MSPSFTPQLIRGEFDVIKELLATEPSAAEGKKKIDHVIDVCGPAPKGNGLQNLRECIIETKWKYDVAPEDRQVRTSILQRFLMTTFVFSSGGFQTDDSELHGKILLLDLLLCLRLPTRRHRV